MSDSKKINYLNLDDKTIGGDTAVREISELTEIITEQNGLMQVKKIMILCLIYFTQQKR